VLRELKMYPMVFLHTTAPAHKGQHAAGSEVLAELIKTYNPRVAIIAGEEPSETRLGKTLVVSPGRLEQGCYADIDVHALTVEHGVLESVPGS
jgi:Icc-related predicted phosphoesterase